MEKIMLFLTELPVELGQCLRKYTIPALVEFGLGLLTEILEFGKLSATICDLDPFPDGQ